MAATRRLLPLAAWLVATAIAAPVVAAQDIDLSVRIDSIFGSTDTLALQRIIDRPSQTQGDDAAAGIARGFAALRLFTITGDEERAHLARDAFEEVGDIAPDDALAWYGLGLTWADGPELNREAPRIVTMHALAEAFGADPASKAIRALRRAIELDPMLTQAAAALVPLALRKHDSKALVQARDVLDRAHSEGRFSLEALTALARAERALGNDRLALDAARRAATMSGNEPAATYDLAKALFGAGDDVAGERAWADAVAGLDPALAEAIHDDLRSIADRWEEERWDRLDLDGRREWIEDFWTTRAALAAVPVAERIGEHYRRLEVARARFYNHRKWGAPPTNALLLERPDLPFDDRGLVYIRHGEPFDVLRSGTVGLAAAGSAPVGESWVYRLPDGEFRLLHFFKYGSAERVPGVAGNPEAMAANGGLGDAWNDYVLVYVLPCGEWADDRIRYDRRLALLRCNQFDQLSISAEVRRDAVDALHSDSDSPDFTRDLPFAFDLYTFRGDRGTTDVTASAVIAADAIEPVPAWQGVAWDLRASLIVADTMFDRVARMDTTLRMILSEPPPEGWLRLTLSLPVVPGQEQAQRIVISDNADPRHGRLAGRALDVPDYTGSRLMISDIVLAEPDSGGTFRRGGIALDLVPTREFPGGAFRAFYEIYNLTPDGTYTTEIEVEKAGGGIGGFVRGIFGGGSEVRLRFDGIVSPNGTLSRELRRVDTSLQDGDYRIRVRVTDHASGRTAEREREFTVVR